MAPKTRSNQYGKWRHFWKRPNRQLERALLDTMPPRPRFCNTAPLWEITSKCNFTFTLLARNHSNPHTHSRSLPVLHTTDLKVHGGEARSNEFNSKSGRKFAPFHNIKPKSTDPQYWNLESVTHKVRENRAPKQTHKEFSRENTVTTEEKLQEGQRNSDLERWSVNNSTVQNVRRVDCRKKCSEFHRRCLRNASLQRMQTECKWCLLKPTPVGGRSRSAPASPCGSHFHL